MHAPPSPCVRSAGGLRDDAPTTGRGATGTPALLAISVVLAVVGIANTLSLSVIERTRESALLRTLVGTLLGAALGAGYAWVGVNALLGEFTTAPLVLAWSQLAVVAVGTILAGLLASVLPARRAAQGRPHPPSRLVPRTCGHRLRHGEGGVAPPGCRRSLIAWWS